jgi:DNA polymerase-3 subunit beta
VGRAVASKTTLPVLSNVLLEAAGDTLTVSATNLDMGIRYRIPARVDQAGRVTLQARVLSDFVSSLPAGEVELFEDQGPTTVLVRLGATQAHVRGHDASDFPTLASEVADGIRLSVEPQAFREAIEQVVFAAATDDSRPVLAGVQVEVSDRTIAMAAADGFRMSVRTLSMGVPIDEPISIIVPARAMSELARVLGESQEPAQLAVTPNQTQLVVTVPDITFMTRLIDGTFPDLKQIIPRDWSTRTVVGRESLLDATRRAAIFARSNNDVVKFEIVPPAEDEDIGRLTVTANAADTGDNRDDVDAQIEGGTLQVAFNGRYLNDLLSVLKSASIALELSGPNSAGVFKPIERDDYVHVIMPMVIGAS